MRHSTLFSLLGIALLTLALSTCAVVMTPQKQQTSVSANTRPATPQLANTQAKTAAETQPSTTTPAPQAEDLPTANPDGKPLAQSMPWKGMPTALLGSTYLGEPDETGEVIDGGLLDGGTPHYWRSHNERHERVFEAVVRGGEVIDVSRWNTGRNYWPPETSLRASALPILDASGDKNPESGAAPDLPDPNDYDDPDDYEADAEDYFAWLGCEDPAQAAYLYWESVAG